MAGMSWDAASFTFLLFLIRVYKTWYFQHIVTDLNVDNHLASRSVSIQSSHFRRRCVEFFSFITVKFKYVIY